MNLVMTVSAGAHRGSGARENKTTTFMVMQNLEYANGRLKKLRKRVRFPSNERILEIATEKLPGRQMEILERSKMHQAIVVRLPVGTKLKEREPFLDALRQETR